MQIKSIGIDLGKTTFHLIALGSHAQVVIRKKFSRSQLLVYTANLPASLIGMEAGVGSHLLGRAWREQGHEVRLIPAQFVRPFVKSNQNDYRDAEAIAEAAERENMRFVPSKTEDQLDLPALHRVRDRLVARDQRDQPDSSLPAGEGNQFSQRAGQPATAAARDPRECRPETEHSQAWSAEFALPGVERLAVADGEPEHRSGTDRQQRPDLGSAAADSWRGSPGIDCRGIGHRQRCRFQKGTRVCCVVGTDTTTMVHRRQDKAAGDQQAGKPLSAKNVHPWCAGCRLASQTRRLKSGEVDQRIRNPSCAQCGHRGHCKQVGENQLGGFGQWRSLSSTTQSRGGFPLDEVALRFGSEVRF